MDKYRRRPPMEGFAPSRGGLGRGGEFADDDSVEGHIMGEDIRRDDQDTEGHQLRATKDDDTEGHQLRATPDDDTEGHLRSNLDDEDTEGHLR